MKEYKKLKNRARHLSRKQRKMKQIMEAETIDALCKDYDGIAWEWLKRLIPKRKSERQKLEEVIDQEGNIRGKEEILRVWRDSYETLGKETEADEKIYDKEFKKRIINEVKDMEKKEIEAKKKKKKKKGEKGEKKKI
jgi:hypothetical protein